MARVGEKTIERLIENAAAGTGKINNLNSLVKKKKPVVPVVPVEAVNSEVGASGEKRKAEEESIQLPLEKKPKADERA